MMAENEVVKYAKYYCDKDEPPAFYNEYFELEDKTFLPRDDVGLKEKLFGKMHKGASENCVLHYFVRDGVQSNLMKSFASDKKVHRRFYAVCSPDFSVDSDHCFSAFNNAAILKNRICASIWQSEFGERVILTLSWGDESTYHYAFSNIEEGATVAVSHQGVQNENIFKKGFLAAVEVIKPHIICWYGKIPDYAKETCAACKIKIVKMQTRYSLVHALKTKDLMRHQQTLFA